MCQIHSSKIPIVSENRRRPSFHQVYNLVISSSTPNVFLNLSNQDLFVEFQSCVSNYLLNISTWISPHGQYVQD